MCGIIGYVGKEKALPILLEGLKRLEYRGYDSAGLVVLDGDRPELVRRAGKVANLETALRERAGLPDSAGLGIAHTRWATHGRPSEENSHPHADCAGRVFVVHNGIIENYAELKTELAAAGHLFRSETDTEVLAHLIESAYRAAEPDGHRLLAAVQTALGRVRGTYGLAVVCADEPDRLVVSRSSSPLLLGICTDGNVVASDASAILAHTKRVVYLEDGEVAEVTAGDFRIQTLAAGPVERAPETLDLDFAQAEKGGHADFMHKEIFEAPDTVVNSSRGRLVAEEGLAKLGGLEPIRDRLRDIERLIIVGCGTAAYAGRIGEYMLEEYAGLPVETDIGSEFRYRKPILDRHTALLAVSQSGETADTLASIREAKEKGILTLGMVNAVGSTIARETGSGVYNHAGPEISVASTKAFISQLTVFALLTVYLGRQRQMSLTTGRRIAEELARLPELLRQVLRQEDRVREIAERHRAAEHMFFLGRKYNYPIALEAALKLKEVSYLHAEGYAAGEFKHGPIAMIDPHRPSFFIAPKDSVYEKTRSNLEEIKARGGPLIALTTEGNTELEKWTEDVIYIPKTLEMLTPILAAVPAYLFAYHMALLRGNDVDKPRNLAKSVTVE